MRVSSLYTHTISQWLAHFWQMTSRVVNSKSEMSKLKGLRFEAGASACQQCSAVGAHQMAVGVN